MSTWTHESAALPSILSCADELIRIRHDIHKHPDLGFDTARTVGIICEALKRFGIGKVDSAIIPGGVIVEIDGNRPGKTVAIRADIDALAMPDHSGESWACDAEICRSHACGHDGHTAWLLGALKALHDDRDFPGRVIGIFQPAEEIGRGAKSVVDAGVLEKYDVAEIYGAHCDSSLPAGTFGFRPGPIQASCDFFYITLKGKGIHAARPQAGIDPTPTAALLINSLQTIVSRKVDPLESAVLSISSINAGRFNAPNVIPEELTMSGTVRTFSETVRDTIEDEMRRMVAAIALAQGCAGELTYDRLTSVMANHPEVDAAMREVARERFGEASLAGITISMSGEDFSEYIRRTPGGMFKAGIGDERHTVGVHNPLFDFNDKVIPAAATLLVLTAKNRLEYFAAKD